MWELYPPSNKEERTGDAPSPGLAAKRPQCHVRTHLVSVSNFQAEKSGELAERSRKKSFKGPVLRRLYFTSVFLQQAISVSVLSTEAASLWRPLRLPHRMWQKPAIKTLWCHSGRQHIALIGNQARSKVFVLWLCHIKNAASDRYSRKLAS